MAASFDIAYKKWVKPFEGYYVWDDTDAGGETYAGISRVFNPSWQGWRAIDFEKHKKQVAKLPVNYKVPGLEGMVEDFYKTMWKKNGFDRLQNQDVANISFDYFVNSGEGNFQKLIGGLVGAKKTSTIIDLLNTGDQAKLHDSIKNARIEFFKNIVKAKPKQARFLDGWLKRVNAFPTLSTGGKIGLGVIVVFVIVTAVIVSLK